MLRFQNRDHFIFGLLNLEYQLFCFPLSCYYKLNNYRFK